MTSPPAPMDPLDVAATAFSSRLRLDILSTLARSPGSTAQQLAAELGVIRSTLGVNLRALEAAGFTVRAGVFQAAAGRVTGELTISPASGSGR